MKKIHVIDRGNKKNIIIEEETTTTTASDGLASSPCISLGGHARMRLARAAGYQP